VATKKPASSKLTPEAQLHSWLERLDPDIQKLAKSVRTAIRKRVPTANELAYDYKTFVVIAYSPDEHGIHGVLSIAARPDGVRLHFMGGPKLPDPKKLLQGKAKQVRFVSLTSADQLKQQDIAALIDAAVDLAEMPLAAQGRGRLVIKSASSK
jgi:hypothetical protein